MAAVDLEHPPEGVVILPERGTDVSYLDPRGGCKLLTAQPRADCSSRLPTT